MSTATTDYVLAPFTVIVDSREQHPYSFTGFKSDKSSGSKPLIIPVEVEGLKTADYSIKGYESRVGIERKEINDAFNTFCHERVRFENELERMMEFDFAAVVIEASWGTILHHPPTKFPPKSFFRTVASWNIKFPKVHFIACETRWFAERWTFRWLEKFWQYEQSKLKGLTR